TSTLPSEATALNRYGRLAESVAYLPQLLEKRGWNTAAFVSNGNIFDDRLGFQRGFSVFRRVLTEEKPTARDVMDPTLAYIASRTSPHFFLYIHVIDPHRAYRLEPPYQQMFPPLPASAPERERLLLDYDRTIRQADDQFARLAEALRAKGWWRGALVLYTSDHGEEFYEHGGLGHGSSLYEEQIRVPLLVKLPGNEEGGTRRSDPVTLADVTPTIAELARIPASKEWIGASMLRPVPAGRDLYFTEELDATRVYALRRGSEKLLVQLYPKFLRALFDLKADPSENHGLALPCGATAPEQTQNLAASFDRWNARDVHGYPGLTLEKVSRDAVSLDLAANLASTPHPFVSAEEFCRFSPLMAGAVLELHRRFAKVEEFRLRLAANDRGDPPVVRVSVSSASKDQSRVFDPGSPNSPIRLTRTAARYIQGETTDEVLRHLRALGYLAGGGE
ncbi:MAG TPA: sulfatase-like hydrolase/transferase, partial [Thermoanaerobaculia bacterium]|nr:sulfatase-like hydrolase/transferase [Thermoanaerobaculia bacterium]